VKKVVKKVVKKALKKDVLRDEVSNVMVKEKKLVSLEEKKEIVKNCYSSFLTELTQSFFIG
jgi:hypothetical protein